MKNAPYAKEICPACLREFVGATIKPAGRAPAKVCPHCQTETPVWKLTYTKKRLAAGKPVQSARNFESVGLNGKRESYQAMTAALVGCYDQLIETTPAASRGVVDGVFGPYIKLAKQMLGVRP